MNCCNRSLVNCIGPFQIEHLVFLLSKVSRLVTIFLPSVFSRLRSYERPCYLTYLIYIKFLLFWGDVGLKITPGHSLVTELDK